MGYHAPSAEEVYRYIFRLDEQERSLSDRFSWSILFINDSSPRCREFLVSYCLDLCLRTADRIRFVFFSEMLPTDMERIADDLINGRIKSQNGFLGTIIKAVTSSFSTRRQYDFEHEPWSELRPSSLRPLRDLDTIRRHVSHECDLKTAMPGSGIALQFAQRLGIGRHVPCFLAFADIGQPKVSILPIGNLTADAAYSRLRTWIDSFYEINHATLDRWKRIEDDIESLCTQGRNGLATVRRWRDERLNTWRTFRRVTEAIHLLTNEPPSSWTRLSCLSEDYYLPWEVRAPVQGLLKLVSAVGTRAQAAQELETAAGRLAGARRTWCYPVFPEGDTVTLPALCVTNATRTSGRTP